MRFLKSFKFLLAIILILRFHEAYSVIYPEIRISDEVKKLINEDIDKSCNFNEDAKTTLPLSLNLVHTSNAVTDLQEILDLIEKNCISDFTKKINKILAKDMLRAHQAKLESIKEEIEDFKAKNLSASFQIKKYLNYIEKNKIEGLMLDPSVQELYNKNKSKFEARKNNCSDVMNLKLPLALHKTKVQGKTGWCYAYAASDLVANFTGKEPSAIYMSTLMNDKLVPKLIGLRGGGMINWTINELIEKGMCSESDLPSSNQDFKTDMKLWLSEEDNNYIVPELNSIFNQLVDMANKYKNTNYSESTMPVNYNLDMINAELCSKDNGNFLTNVKLLFPKLNLEDLSKILMESYSTEAFKNIVLKTCPVKMEPELQNIKVKTSIFRKFQTIDEQLDKGNIVGMNYDANLLIDYTKRNALSIHSSTIVGRRFNPTSMSCEYMVRNSWGDSCEVYSKDYDCFFGNIWIAEEFLKFNNPVIEVFYLEKK